MTSYTSSSLFNCSSCGGLISRMNPASGNTFGVRHWTDGWWDAPWLPENPPLVKCRLCDELLWFEDLTEITEPTCSNTQGDESESGDSFNMLELPDYFRYSDSNPDIDPQRMRYVRMRAWRKGNDVRRDSDSVIPLSDTECANLEALISFLDEGDDYDRLIKAEIMRELGRFSEAAKLLTKPFDLSMGFAAVIIRKLVEVQDVTVAEIKQPSRTTSPLTKTWGLRWSLFVKWLKSRVCP